MPRSYTTAPDRLQRKINRIVRDIHGRLLPPIDPSQPNGERYELRITTLLAFAPRNKWGEPTGLAAIVVRGRPAYASIRITKLAERVAGLGDAVMTIDGDQIKEMDPATLDAIIDHELTHLATVDGREGPEFDDHGRLKLRIRPHDFEVGWFDEVAERHGVKSIEVQQAGRLVARQMYFPGFEITARELEPTA